MSPSRSRRRSPAQWQALIDQWKQSGFSAREFCRQQALGYANFRKWCKRLDAEKPSTATPAFIDLGALASPGSPRWHIELDLGGGMTLRLSRS